LGFGNAKVSGKTKEAFGDKAWGAGGGKPYIFSRAGYNPCGEESGEIPKRGGLKRAPGWARKGARLRGKKGIPRGVPENRGSESPGQGGVTPRERKNSVYEVYLKKRRAGSAGGRIHKGGGPTQIYIFRPEWGVK